jgi:hypothetical protein
MVGRLMTDKKQILGYRCGNQKSSFVLHIALGLGIISVLWPIFLILAFVYFSQIGLLKWGDETRPASGLDNLFTTVMVTPSIATLFLSLVGLARDKSPKNRKLAYVAIVLGVLWPLNVAYHLLI